MKLNTLLALLVTLAPLSVAAAELIRYENEQGIMVISHTIPTHLVHKGYTRLSENGRVIEVVPSEEDRVLMSLEAERRAEEEKARDVKLREDEELMRLYASPLDVEAARDRKLAEIERRIGRLRGTLDGDRNQKRRLEEDAAQRERAGRPMSPEVIRSLETVTARIAETERKIGLRQDEQATVRKEFERDLERIKILYNVTDDPSQVAASAGK